MKTPSQDIGTTKIEKSIAQGLAACLATLPTCLDICTTANNKAGDGPPEVRRDAGRILFLLAGFDFGNASGLKEMG